MTRHSGRFAITAHQPALQTNEGISLQANFAEDMVLGPGAFFAKIALLLLYLRLFGLKTAVRYTIYFGLIFAVCLYWINIPFLAYYCAPAPGKKWDLQDLDLSKCGKSRILGVVQGSLNVVLDLFIFILPIPVVMSLQMNARKRVAVLTVFLTGVL